MDTESPKQSIQPTIECAFTRMVPVGDLKPHPKNPREHGKKQIKALAEAIRRNGFRRPIIASSRSKTIIAGHGTLAAAIHLGMKEVPVDFQEFDTDAAEAAFLVSDNHIARLATTDSALVAEILAQFSDDLDLEAFGFDSSLNVEFLAEPTDKPDVQKARTKNGAEVASTNEIEPSSLIVATVPRESARKFSKWKEDNELDSDDEAIAIIFNNL